MNFYMRLQAAQRMMFFARSRLWAFASVVVFLVTIVAPNPPADAEPTTFVGHPQVDSFIETMVNEYGFDTSELQRLFTQTQHKSRIIELKIGRASCRERV